MRYSIERFPTLGLAAANPAPAQGGTGDEDERVRTFPRPSGRRNGLALAAVVVIDDSGSTGSTDPKGHRYVAAKRVVRWVRDDAMKRPASPQSGQRGRRRQQFDDAIGVVHFADEPRPVLPLTSLKSHFETVIRSLNKATDGGTAIVPAMDAAAALHRSDGKRIPITLVFTDGGIGEDLNQLATALDRHEPGSVHVVIFDETGGAQQVADQWARLPFGSVTAVDSMATSGIESLYARPIVEAMGLTWRELPQRTIRTPQRKKATR